MRPTPAVSLPPAWSCSALMGVTKPNVLDMRQATPTIVEVPFIDMSVNNARPRVSLLDLLRYLHER